MLYCTRRKHFQKESEFTSGGRDFQTCASCRVPAPVPAPAPPPAPPGPQTHGMPIRALERPARYTFPTHPGKMWCPYRNHWVLEHQYGYDLPLRDYCNGCRVKRNADLPPRVARYADCDHPGVLWCSKGHHFMKEAEFSD